MSIRTQIEKSLCKAVTAVMRIYGVKADIFYPTADNSMYSGANDGSIKYDDKPSLTVKILTVDNFGDSYKSSDFLINFDASNNKMYVECSHPELPVNSLIVLVEEKEVKYGAYKVTGIKEFRYTASSVLMYYEIVPVNSKFNTIMDTSIELQEFVGEEMEQLGSQDNNTLLNMEESITDNLNKPGIDKKLTIEDKNKLFLKRKVNKFNLAEEQ